MKNFFNCILNLLQQDMNILVYQIEMISIHVLIIKTDDTDMISCFKLFQLMFVISFYFLNNHEVIIFIMSNNNLISLVNLHECMIMLMRLMLN